MLIPNQDIFETPKFNEDNASAADVVQGKLGDCWLLAALMSLSAKPGLIKRLCVDRDEKIGVYGFVFFRGKHVSVMMPFLAVLAHGHLTPLRWRLGPRGHRRQTIPTCG